MNCLALLKETIIIEVLESRERKSFVCPVCDVEYVPTDTFGAYETLDYLRYRNCYIPTDDIIEHGKQLALIAMNLPYKVPSNPPFRNLLLALSRARKFIHFTTSGMSLFLVGVFKLAAQRLPVRGIVSNADQPILDDLKIFSQEAPTLRIKPLDPDSGEGEVTQELIIVDGLLAFKGIKNLNLSEWREAPRAEDVVEIVTNIEDIIVLNNHYFSPLWKNLDDHDTTIVMEREPLSLRIKEKKI
jgi:hypothetical protein